MSAPVPNDERFGVREAGLLVTLGALWGFSFLFIELALRGLGPLWIVAGRTLVGATVLFAIVRLRGQRLPRSLRLWGHLAVLGTISNALPWGAIAWAQRSIPSGLAALLMALVPTSTFVVSAVLGMERVTRDRIVGLVLALAGVGVIVAPDLDDRGRVTAIAVVVIATVLYAAGAVYAKRNVSGRAGPLVIATGQVSTAFLVILPGALLFDTAPTTAALEPVVLAAVAALGVLGTGLAFLVFYVLIARVGATNTTLVTYLIPLVAVVAGALVLGERLGWSGLLGGLLIGVGIYLAQRGTRPSAAEQLEEFAT